MAGRTSQVATEALTAQTPNAVVSQVGVEVIGQWVSSSIISQIVVEALTYVPTAGAGQMLLMGVGS
jgi:hypothetical protein